MTDFVLSLKIETAGERQAMAALEGLDKKGRQVVEDASGALGRAMGDVALAYVAGGHRMRRALEDVAQGHRDNIKAAEQEQRAAERAVESAAQQTERLAMRNEHAMAGAARGLEMLGRTGELTGRSLDAVVGQISQMAFAFGPGGQLVAAIGISTAAIIEMFMRTSREQKRLVDQLAADFERISDMSSKAQGDEATNLYSGKWNAKDPLDRRGIVGLSADQAALQRRIAAGTTTFTGAYGVQTKALTDDAREAADKLEKVKEKLAQIVPLWEKLTKRGGSIERAGKGEAAEDLAGFIADQLKAQQEADKRITAAARKAHDRAIKEFSDGVEERRKAADVAVATEVARLTNANDPNASLNENLSRALARSMGTPSEANKAGVLAGLLPDADEIRAAIKEVSKIAADAVREDPFLAALRKQKTEREHLAEQLGRELGSTLGNSLEAGFAAGFSGKGIAGVIKGFGDSMLSGLGDIFVRQGEALISFSAIMKGLGIALANPLTAPFAAAAEGAALIALGAALKAAVHGPSSGGSTSSYSGGSSVSISRAPDFLSFGVSASGVATTSQNAPPARPTINIGPIIGNDPKVQRDIAEIVNSAYRRNLLAPGATG